MKTIATTFLLFFTISMSAQSQLSVSDYANFDKYAKDNFGLGLPGKNEKRVVFMGNSITEAWVNYSPTFFSQNNYIGRGISGQVTHQMLLRFRADVLTLKPKAVVILAGTNDIAQNSGPVTLEEIEDNIKSMADLALSHNIKVILCSVLPAKDYPWKPGLNPLEKIPALNKMLSEYAESSKNITYANLYAAMLDKDGGMRVPEFTTADDLVHPNKAGYEVMEGVIQPIIQRVIK